MLPPRARRCAGDREPQPGAAEAAGGGAVGLLEGLEDLAELGLAHADAGVRDGQQQLSPSGRR
jgi:hypothetical protein